MTPTRQLFVLQAFLFVGCASWSGCANADAPLGGESAALPGQTSPVFALAFSADGKLLATGGAPWEPWEQVRKVPNPFARSGQLYIWDWRTKGKVIARSDVDSPLAIPQYPFMSIVFSPDGKSLIAAGTGTQGVLREIEMTCYYYVHDVPDGVQAQCGTRGRIKENEFFFKRKINRVWQLAISPDGRSLAYCSTKETVVIDENYDDIGDRKFLNGPAGVATCLSYAPDGKSIATGGGPDKAVKLLNVTPGKEITEVAALKHDAVVSWVGFTKDGQTLAATDDSGVLKLWDVAQRKERHTIQAHPGDIGALAVSPDGKVAATGGDKAIKLWDLSTGKELKSLPNQKGRIQALAFSPDGKILASSACDVSKEGEVRMWDVAKLLEGKP